MGRIMSLKPTTSVQKAVADIAYPKSFTTTATEHGKKYEGVARKLLEHLVGPIEERGLIIHPVHKFLAGSPGTYFDWLSIL